MPNILAVAEQRDGALRKVSNEVVTAARQVADAVGGEVHVLLIGGPGVEGAAELARFGADRIRVQEAEALAHYTAEGYTGLVVDEVKGGDYFAVFFPASTAGKDLAPRVAARLDVPLVTDATAVEVEGGELVITRPVYGGRAFAKVSIDGSPRLVSLRPNVFRPEEKATSAQPEVTAASVDAATFKVKTRETVESKSERPDVGEATVVVSGGRGMRGPENWQLLEDLVDALGDRCALGASRSVVDAGWRPHGEQVGQTGKTVAPQLYIAVGISGAMQHLAGMRTAKTIVAINKDPDAPIFKLADYGIVGDAFEVLPKLTEAVRTARG